MYRSSTLKNQWCEPKICCKEESKWKRTTLLLATSTLAQKMKSAPHSFWSRKLGRHISRSRTLRERYYNQWRRHKMAAKMEQRESQWWDKCQGAHYKTSHASLLDLKTQAKKITAKISHFSNLRRSTRIDSTHRSTDAMTQTPSTTARLFSLTGSLISQRCMTNCSECNLSQCGPMLY